VVNAPDYAALLREAGVEVHELLEDPPMSFRWVVGLNDQDVDHEEPEDDHHAD
jgi:hypothetical protein